MIGCGSSNAPQPDATADATADATVDTRIAADSAAVDTTADDTTDDSSSADAVIDTADAPTPGPSGSLDTTFGGGKGFRCHVFGATGVVLVSGAQAMAIAPDSKIVLAGDASGFAVARFTSEGDADSSFGSTGAARYETAAPGTASDRAFGVAIWPDKKIVLAGVHQVFSLDGGASSQAVLAQLTEAGDKDLTAFGGSWFTYPSYGGADSTIRAIAITSGKLLVAGIVRIGAEQRAFVARHLPSGLLDSAFAVGGIRSFSFDGVKDSAANAFAIAPDGKIVVAGNVLEGAEGSGMYHFGLARLDSSGALDTAFGTNGVTHVAISGGTDAALSIGQQSTGALVAAGVTNKGFGLARFTASGALDSSFAGGGKLQTKFGIEGDWATSLLVLPASDRVVLGGLNTTAGASTFALEGFLKDGAYDTAFGSGGLVTTKLGTDPSVVFALARQSDGRILAGGKGNKGMCVARYWP